MKKGSINPHLYKARIGSCDVCGKEFRAVSDFKERKQKYCSKDCWSVRGKVTKKCRNCGKDFVYMRSQKKVYCSFDCRTEDYKVRFSGDKSHLWEGGKTSENKKIRSSSGFKEWRSNVFTRDNHKCVLCGNGRDLHPHHIIHLADDKENALNIRNGVTLCSTCHSIVHNRIIGKGDKEKFSDPKYIDVIIQRWQEYTGKDAIDADGVKFNNRSSAL